MQNQSEAKMKMPVTLTDIPQGAGGEARCFD